MSDFDPYYQWLGIPLQEQPASHYRLLGIPEFDGNVDIIKAAAERQTIYLRTLQAGEHELLVAQLLNEVSQARVTLLNVDQKAEYDEELRKQQTPEPVPEPSPPPIPVVQTPPPTPVVVRGTVTQDFPVSVVQSAKRPRRRKRKEIWKQPVVIGVSVVGVIGVFVLVISFMVSGDAELVVSNTPPMGSVPLIPNPRPETRPTVPPQPEPETARPTSINAYSLKIVVSPDDWGVSAPADIKKVCESAAAVFMTYFPDHNFPPIMVQHDNSGPTTLYKRGQNNEYIMKLNTSDRAWAQLAFQFAHEFCHIVCNYRDATNQQLWFEKTLCQCASLYALKQMASQWKTNPPYSNWKSYATSLDDYADDLIAKYGGHKDSIAQFYRANQTELSKTGTNRDLITYLAIQLLPLFEATPTAWQALRYINLGPIEENVSFQVYLQGWHDRAPKKHRVFIQQIATQFGLKTNPANLARDPITNKIGMTFNNIPAGTFTMGSPESEADREDEEHQHKVTISKAFYMQTTEVTQSQWTAVMGTEPWKGKSLVKEGPHYAASYVNWNDAVAYCKKLSDKEGKTYRLPTEAEWEYACRAGTETTWSFGDDEKALGDYAWYRENAWNIGEKYAHQVELKKPNAFGLYNMHGNVWEWCGDYFGEDYYNQSPEKDPMGPARGAIRILRGGSWGSSSRNTRSASRNTNGADIGNFNLVGFRLVRELD